MILRFSKILFIFLKSIFLYNSNNKTKSPELYYCGSCLRIALRYPVKSRNDFLISIRIYKNIISSLIFKNIEYENFEKNNGVAIIDRSLNLQKSEEITFMNILGLKLI